MVVESLQCPKCGSPLPVRPGATSVTCTYCDSSLRVTRGSSGSPVGVQEDIRDNTGLIAKERALVHVLSRHQHLVAERDGLAQRLRTEITAAVEASVAERVEAQRYRLLQKGLGAAFVSSFLSMIVFNASLAVALVVMLSVIGFIMVFGISGPKISEGVRAMIQEQHERNAREAHGARLSELESDIQVAEARIEDLRRGIHQLSMDV